MTEILTANMKSPVRYQILMMTSMKMSGIIYHILSLISIFSISPFISLFILSFFICFLVPWSPAWSCKCCFFPLLHVGPAYINSPVLISSVCVFFPFISFPYFYSFLSSFHTVFPVYLHVYAYSSPSSLWPSCPTHLNTSNFAFCIHGFCVCLSVNWDYYL